MQAVEHLRRTLGAHRQVKVRLLALQDVHEVNWEMSRMPPPTCLTQQPRGFDQFALGQILSARSVHAMQPTAATETDPLSTRLHHRLLPTRRLAYFGLLQPPRKATGSQKNKREQHASSTAQRCSRHTHNCRNSKHRGTPNTPPPSPLPPSPSFSSRGS
ncbi:hypothetical protein TraAM80_09659 [Trypanosoma rangeli]|uniref:Uncharacterized protein n=1 Tax=Trypanosoma rangeli TaxID=5698 RepID=A0A3R7JWX6_TRYRA|nr:uncharacterized protein TraAM80_09659 [Trypanosoma rangeli]RNE96763.1 hypothetical protein TraAM80_09659 [Trypanosoma rangeli]|eukprot:RNE96763.1 hypothetical protein TraAM80_09659 [Trypanosoma rangeli]